MRSVPEIRRLPRVLARMIAIAWMWLATGALAHAAPDEPLPQPGAPAPPPTIDAPPAPPDDAAPSRDPERPPATPEADAAASGDEPTEAPAAAKREMPPPAETSTDPGTRLPDVVDLGDPMAPVEAALTALADRGFSVAKVVRTENALQGDTISTTVVGREHEYLQFVLEQVAADGYLVLLRPIARDGYEVVVLRARPGQERGMTFIGVDEVRIDGEFRSGENAASLRELVDDTGGVVVPVIVQDSLRAAGYRAALRPAADGSLEVAVQPGRAIRRVRVRGHVPLSERELRQVLSLDARPGALAPGRCVDRKLARRGAERPPLCAPGDLLCESWVDAERKRVERYLFDEGYLRGTVDFALRCGTSSDEVDLYVLLDKGKGYRIRDPQITGNLGTPDQRWVARVFRPTFGPILPIPKRITRKHVDEAKEKVAREYSTPRKGPRGRARRALSLPYPAVRVETNFDRLRPGDVPAGTNRIPMQVDVQLGTGVDTAFLGESRVSEARLLAQLQLFGRREPANAATAAREAANLRNYLQSRGYMLATVRGQFQDFGTLHKLAFDIHEGPKVRIRHATLRQSADVPELVRQEIAREYDGASTLRSRADFTDVGARKDIAALLAAYNKRGYLCARAAVRVAFWPEGLQQRRRWARIDMASALDESGTPTWLTTRTSDGGGLDPDGLDALGRLRSARAYVEIEVVPGPRVVTSSRERVRHLEVPIPASREVESLPDGEGAWGAPRALRDGPLRRKGDERVGGIPVTLALDRDVERDVVRRYRNSGYPLADAELRWVVTTKDGRELRVPTADRLTSPEVGLCQDAAGAKVATVETELAVYEGRQARFGTTLVRGNFKTRYRRRNGKPAALAREIAWREGELYSMAKVDRTRAGIDGMGVAENVQIREQQRNCNLDDDPSQDCVVHQVINITEAKDRAMDLQWGFGGATLDPLYGFVRPSFPNMWGTAWDLTLDAHVGANLKSLRDLLCAGESCYERSGRVTLTRRRIGGSPLTFDIGGQLQRRVTPARGQIDTVLGQVRLSWPINRNWQVYIGYLIQAANISKDLVKPSLGVDVGCGTQKNPACRPPNRGEAIVPDRTAALQTGVRWEKVDNAFNPDKGIIATADAMLASPCLGGQDWWVRLDFGWEHFIPLRRTGGRLNFRYALSYGHEVPIPLPRRCGGNTSAKTTSVPEVWRYFGGGTRDLGVRGILPQTMLVDVEKIQTGFGAYTLRPTAEGGHIRALGTIALQLVSVRNFLGGRLAHSIFADVGVLTQRWQQVVWSRDFRRSVGINFIKYDIKIVTVSLGYAVLVPNRIWPGNVRPTDDQNGRFVFDVGATF